MLQALFSPEEHPVLPRTLATWPASSCHQLLSLLCAENAAELASSNRKLLNQMLLQMTGTGIHDTYHTPVFDDGSRLTLNLSVAGQATLTAYATGITPNSLTLTPVHPAWNDVCNGPEHAALIREWSNWAAEPAHGERRAEALRRVTECVVWGETELHLDNLRLSSLPILLPPMLKELYVRKNQLSELPRLPDTLTRLDVSHNCISNTRYLSFLPNTLTILDISHNYIMSETLPHLPDSLTVLNARYSRLAELPDLPATLKTLNVSNNELTVLPELPAALVILGADDNQVTELSSLPPTLTELYINRNQLTALPALPDSLKRLDVYHNRLTALPTLPDSLKELWAGENLLTTLPTLPTTLIFLNVFNNRLANLPELPAALTELFVEINLLTSLPALPASLRIFGADCNQLTSLPDLPASLIKLNASKNQLTALPDLPDGIRFVFFLNNPCSPVQLRF